MTLTFSRPGSTYGLGDSYADALEEWRRTARVASDLWYEYGRTSRDFRAVVFRAYLVALDAEERAASVLRYMSIPRAA
jgi:hypothetical protein